MADLDATYSFFEGSDGNISTASDDDSQATGAPDSPDGEESSQETPSGENQKGAPDGDGDSGAPEGPGPGGGGEGESDDSGQPPAEDAGGAPSGPLSGDEIRALVKEHPWMGQLSREVFADRELTQQLTQYKNFGEAILGVRGKPATEVTDPSQYQLSQDYAKQIDPEFDTFFRNAAANAGISKESAEAFYNQYGNFFKQRFDAMLADQKAEKLRAEEELTKHYGGTKQYKEALSNLRTAVVNVGGEDLRSLTQDYNLENDARWIRTLVKFGELASEGTFIKGNQTAPEAGGALEYGDDFQKVAGE